MAEKKEGAELAFQEPIPDILKQGNYRNFPAIYIVPFLFPATVLELPIDCTRISIPNPCSRPWLFSASVTKSLQKIFSPECKERRLSRRSWLLNYISIFLRRSAPLKQIQHVIEIDVFSYMQMIFRFGHIIEQKFQNQGAAKSPAFDFKLGKAQG